MLIYYFVNLFTFLARSNHESFHCILILLSCIYDNTKLYYTIPVPQVRDSTGARIVFPSPLDEDQDTVTLIGKKESVEKARVELDLLIKNLVHTTFSAFPV